jgi:hypothetical protein
VSIDCGYAAVATQGGSDNLFTVVSLATLTGSTDELCLHRRDKVRQAGGGGRTSFQQGQFEIGRRISVCQLAEEGESASKVSGAN